MTAGQSPWDDALAAGWEPPRIDTSTAHPNRVFNYLIGGKDHFEADRTAAEALIRARPDTVATARAIDAFTRRATTEIARAGVRQFLQLGTAIAIAGSNDRAAAAAAPDTRLFVYVASDPISLAHARALLVGRPGPAVGVIGGDFREPHRILADPLIAGRLDPHRPVGLLLFGMLDFIASDSRARRALDFLTGHLPAGSMIAFYHVTETESPQLNDALDAALAQKELELTPRDPRHVAELVEGYRLVEPGLVPITRWRPDAPDPHGAARPDERVAAVGGVILTG